MHDQIGYAPSAAVEKEEPLTRRLDAVASRIFERVESLSRIFDRALGVSVVNMNENLKMQAVPTPNNLNQVLGAFEEIDRRLYAEIDRAQSLA